MQVVYLEQSFMRGVMCVQADQQQERQFSRAMIGQDAIFGAGLVMLFYDIRRLNVEERLTWH